MTLTNLRHGIFLPPFHPMEENPTACLDRDLELIAWLDRLGFHEAWIGEHHSAGFEIIASPEIFIAIVADRIIQLDHHTRGRVMFGVGPGLLASDAIMLGIDPMVQRDRMEEGIDVILRLFRGEVVTEKTDWYTLVNARLHLPPYTKPHPEVAVVSSVTPSGGRLAGKYDLAMICVAATNPFGYDALASNWKIACDIAAEHGRSMDPQRLRLVGPMHLAETREQAWKNARFGFERYLNYLNNNQRRSAAMVRRQQVRRRRYARRCDCIDRAALRKTGDVRRLSAAGAQLGRLGADEAFLRALCPLCDAAFQRQQQTAHRLLRVVRRASRRVRRQAPGGGARDVRQI